MKQTSVIYPKSRSHNVATSLSTSKYFNGSNGFHANKYLCSEIIDLSVTATMTSQMSVFCTNSVQQ